MNLTNPYQPIQARLIDVKDESPTIKTFIFENTNGGLRFDTGQFVQLYLPGSGEAPFTPSSNPVVTEQFELSIMGVGRVTNQLHALAPGVQLGVRGPLGTGYPVSQFRDKMVYIVGGGCGLAPLRSLLYALLNEKDSFRKIILRYGARNPAEVIYKEQLRQWHADGAIDIKLTVDRSEDNWDGEVGVVTHILQSRDLLDDQTGDINLTQTVAVVCGPPIMMRFAIKSLLEMGFADSQIYLSMEKNMSCGIGKCGHCRLGRFYCCDDGPVFTYDQIKMYPEIWE